MPRCVVCAVGAFALSACASRSLLPPTELSADTQRTLAIGFQQISDRYVDYLPVGSLAIEGLRGLNAIDPDFRAEREGDVVSFGIGASRHHTVSAPNDADADAWAALVTDAIRLSQKDSAGIRVASTDRIYEAIFDGSLTLLDSYSRYAGAEEAAHNRDKRSGFGGIGVVVRQMKRGASVVEVMYDSPALQAGIVEGDLITHIDSQPVGPTIDPSDAARGPIGSNVALRVERQDGSIVNVEIKRQRIVIPTVDVSVNDGIVFARITSFNRSTARHLAAQLTAALQKLNGAAKGLVLDLRGNPGGLLSEAVRVADLFIADGRILTTSGRHPASVHDYEAIEDDIGTGLPMVVLVNGRSASASEIVAAALQDHDRAVVVGSSSYGKGTVQMVIPLPNEGELTVTWSKFITPSGYVLNGLGVHPSICTSAPVANADQLIGQAVDSGPDLSHVFEEWRGIDRLPNLDRASLRALCPSSDSAGTLDGLVAQSLIADKRSYQRVLSAAPTMVAARK